MSLFYVSSKVLWMLAAPSNVLVFATAIGFAALVMGWTRTGRALVGLAAIGLLVAGFSPLGPVLMYPLEERFPPFVEDGLPVEGIILLGGAEVPEIVQTRHVMALNEAGERVLAFAALARAHPQARLVFSGGEGQLLRRTGTEADAIQPALVAAGLDLSRVTFESQARNTVENAANVRALVAPKPGSRWLLVTSAFHMPRAIGTFRTAGFPVVAYPVDYRTWGVGHAWTFFPSAGAGLNFTDTAVKEWVGLLAYRLSGRSGAVLPGPDEPGQSMINTAH